MSQFHCNRDVSDNHKLKECNALNKRNELEKHGYCAETILWVLLGTCRKKALQAPTCQTKPVEKCLIHWCGEPIMTYLTVESETDI